jgi:hypothetical protein
VLLFMKALAVSELHYGYYVTVEDEEIEKAEADATEVFKKGYKLSSAAPTDLYASEIADLHTALLFYSPHPELIIRRLRELQSFGYFRAWFSSIIHEYEVLIEMTEGSFSSIFKDNLSGKFKISLKNMSSLWSEITRILTMAILFKRIEGNVANDKKFEDDIDLKEIEALRDLEKYLDCAITEENAKERGSFFPLPNKEHEAFFFKRLKTNPFWDKYF